MPTIRVLGPLLLSVFALAACGRSSLRTGPSEGMDAGMMEVDGEVTRPDRDLPDAVVPSCGDGTCGADETCMSCPVDCGSCGGCGDGSCDPDRMEDCRGEEA